MTTTVLGDARVTECRIAELVVDGVPYLSARFDVEVYTNGRVRLAELMDALAGKVPAGAVPATRVHAYPAKSITPPCAVVGYPEAPVSFDMTMARGSDVVTIPVWFVTGKAVERTARDTLSGVLTGAVGIKEALESGQLTTEDP